MFLGFVRCGGRVGYSKARGVGTLWRFGTPVPCNLIVAFVELLGVGSLWAQLVRVPWAQVALRWGDTWHPALVCTSHGFVFQAARVCSFKFQVSGYLDI